MKYQKEYEAYMKQVTDSFIAMQSETTIHRKNVMSHMLVVEWDGGLDWKATKTGEMYRDGNLMEENRQYNSKIAKDYLRSNILTYDEWAAKFINQL